MKLNDCIECISTRPTRVYSLKEADDILKEYKVLDSKGNISKKYRNVLVINK